MLGRWNFPSQLPEGKTPQTQPSVETKQKEYGRRLTRRGNYNVLAHFSSIRVFTVHQNAKSLQNPSPTCTRATLPIPNSLPYHDLPPFTSRIASFSSRHLRTDFFRLSTTQNPSNLVATSKRHSLTPEISACTFRVLSVPHSHNVTQIQFHAKQGPECCTGKSAQICYHPSWPNPDCVK